MRKVILPQFGLSAVRLSALAAAAIAACTTGCKDNAVASVITTPPIDAIPAEIQAVGGTTFQDYVGSELVNPLKVVVRDRDHRPIQGVSVHFAVIVGDGVLSLATLQTDAFGAAASRWTLGPTPGEQVVTATVSGLTPVRFTAMAVLPPFQGHPNGIVVDSIRGLSSGVAIIGRLAILSHPLTRELVFVDLGTKATLGRTLMPDAPVDVVAPTTGNGPIVTATSGRVPLLWFVDAATRLRADSVELPARPMRLAMTSTGSRVFVQMSNSRMAIFDVSSHSLAEVAIGDTALVMRMASGDSLLYLGMKSGDVLEVSAINGVVRRKFKVTKTVADMFVSPDGRTLLIADGTTIVHIVALVPGARDEAINFDETETARVYAVGVTPDGTQLWAAATGDLFYMGIGNRVFVARFQTAQSLTAWSAWSGFMVPAANANRILFDANGRYAIVQDDGANRVQPTPNFVPRVFILR